MVKYTRKISTIYILQEDSPYFESYLKICRTRTLAEHYRRILEPKWIEAFGFGLRIVEEKFYEDLTIISPEFETEIDNHIIQVIMEQLKNERTEIGKNVLKQLLESVK